MNYDHVHNFTVLAGVSGSGKTHRFLQLWDASKAKYKFAFDPGRELARKRKLKYCLTVEQMLAALHQGVPVLFDPSKLFPGKYGEALAFFCRWVYAVCQKLDGPKLLAIEEIQKFTRTSVGGVPPALNEILDDGRKHELDLLCVVNKGMSKLAEDLKGQVTEIYVFKTIGSRSLDWLEHELGMDRNEAKNLRMPEKGRGPDVRHFVL